MTDNGAAIPGRGARSPADRPHIMHLDLGEGWRIRRYRRDDKAALVRYADNPAIARQLRDRFPHPYTPPDADRWLDRVLADPSRPDFAIASARELVGGIGLTPQEDVYRRSAEIGYWLGEPFWGRGIATRAVRALTDWAFAELDLVRIYATVFANNPASTRVLEKAGYALEGRLRKSITKLGATLDSRLYAAVRPDDRAEQ